MNDSELIQGCLKDDRRCQNALYKKYYPLMSSIALRYSVSEEEAMQHINLGFLKAMKNLSSYRAEFAFATWIRNILIHHIIDENRKNKKYTDIIQVSSIEEIMPGSDFNFGEQKLEEIDVLDLLRKLPETSRKVFTLFAIDGFKHAEIAKLLGISEGTSKWHVNEARKRLTEILNTQSIKVIKAS